jgi:hypothetical protein
MRDKINKLKEKYPDLSSIMIFIKAIKGTGLDNRKLRSLFNKWVDKEDWAGSNREEIISWLKKEILK